jgi:polysaccharide export outer membrane protein
MVPLIALALALQTPPPPSPPASPPATWPPPSGAAHQAYRIGRGDILRVTVYGHDDLCQTVVVQADGSVVLPLIGALPAADATPAEIEREITLMLSEGLIRDPQVTVVVQEYRSRVVFVVGEVARPGAFPLAGATNVVEILARAGPLSANAGTELVIVRPAQQIDRALLPHEAARPGGGPGGPPRAQVYRVDVREIRAGRLDKNLALQPNDTVFVPEAPKVYVSGEVRNPGAFAYAPGLTVRQAVSLAGGFTEEAAKRGAQVVRQVSGRPKTFSIKLDEPVQPGDTVLIKARLF